MIELVLDASVVLKWFAPAEEPRAAEARGFRDRYRAGELMVTAPSLLPLELINVAGRRWGWSREALLQLAASLDELEFDMVEAELGAVAAWTGQGLTAYDAAYVAVAEERGIPLITDDGRILAAAPSVARPLSGRAATSPD
ncbi:MAG: PIN domain-containing protein [Acidobacteria bacterium]|nr:PIN domain-containing protein [Acidobacteriota bacterium]